MSVADIKKDNQHAQEEEENIDFEKEEQELASKAFNKADAWKAAVPEVKFYIIGAVGCAIAGGVFPAWGIVFAELIGLLFYPVFPCDESLSMTYGYPTCDGPGGEGFHGYSSPIGQFHLDGFRLRTAV